MNTLFVGNLPYEATKAELSSWFAAAGVEVRSVSLEVDRISGRLRGFAYVVLESDVQSAVRECNGRSFLGRTLVVGQPPTATASQLSEVTVGS